ncbi:glycosyltransferase family 2 protein [Duganella vulcania]|uniref:Glycosyltransferase n=1 Tax=Duganella vulcania TaxID=2692166 RepID=A0A845GY07_9BURK|nr:glycosyltransferase family 2 protein [Duganella vulcania]MYM98845.1 glycosyltransferase [Duganella vulcania]
MLCSVIMPLYNKAAFVEMAIRSVLDQSHAEVEVIVVDDGSRDSGADVVAAMDEPRVRLLRVANGGVSLARNRGIEVARGDLICFLDADDWYQPGYLAAVVAMAERHPEGAFYATAYRRIPDGSAEAQVGAAQAPAPFEVIEDGFYRLRFGSLFCTNSVAVRRRDLLPFAPYFPVGESLGEDLDLWFRLMERLTLVYCSTPLVAYRVAVSGSLVASNAVTALLPALQRLERRVQAGSVPAAMREAALWLVADARISVARSACLNGRRAYALRQLLGIRNGVRAKRWWVTLLMCVPGGRALVQCGKSWL